MRLILAMALGCIVASCTNYVDRASIAVNTAGRLDIDLETKSSTSRDAEPNPASLTEQQQADLEEYKRRTREQVAEMRECLAGNMTYDTDAQAATITLRNMTVEQVRAKSRCIPALDRAVDLEFARTRGWLRDTLTTTLSLNLPVEPAGGPGRLMFPSDLNLQFEQPVNAAVTTASPAVDIRFAGQDSDRIGVQLAPVESVVEQFRREQDADTGCERKSRDPCPAVRPHTANVVMTFTGYESKYGLGDILAFFSILFGSGLAVTVGSRILAVRTEPKKPEST